MADRTARRLITWDFDLTVLRVHSFALRLTPGDVPRRWEADVADLACFRRCVRCALDEGYEVAIASFGLFEVIEGALMAGDLVGGTLRYPTTHSRQ